MLKNATSKKSKLAVIGASTLLTVTSLFGVAAVPAHATEPATPVSSGAPAYLVSTDNGVSTYSFGQGSTVVVTKNQNDTSPGAKPQVNLGTDDKGSFIVLSPNDQKSLVNGSAAGVTTIAALIAPVFGAGVGIVAGFLTPYASDTTCSSQNKSLKIWVTPGPDGSIVAQDHACV